VLLGRGAALILGLEVELELRVAFPGKPLQAVTLDMVRVGQADRPEPLRGEPCVDLVEVVSHQLLLGIGRLALVGLAGVLQRGVVETITA